ncbi:MAG TPA: biotin transporter BioY [Candidatus Ruthenibacterium avium]|uniref:Biotin transporter n=1 Tax=Candidatus Ruthenibacterium avium TaxID=2838751 RepID=A0A9D2S1J7_9FIRM|nr:biotin transporter BioY [Candidatus Ruthenibacterium avium]
MKKTRTKEFCMAGLLAACTAVLAQIVIPIGPVPFNLAVFGAFLAGMLLSPGMAVLSMATYWLMAAIGLPVMAGLQGGLGAVLSPTGGYMAGYLLLAGCTALVAERPMPMRLAGMALGLVLCYTLGTVWFICATGTALSAALAMCVLPFIPADVAKGIAAAWLAQTIKRRVLQNVS